MPKLTTRRTSWILLSLMALLICGAAGQAEQIELTFSTWLSADAVDRLEGVLAEYERLNPHVKVDLYYTGWDEYHDRMVALMAVGLAPDVMVISRYYTAPWAELGLILPLDEFVAADQDLDLARDLFPGVLTSGMYQERLYGFPIYNNPAVIGYNPGLFDQSGLSSPKDSYWNWDSFLSAGKMLTQDVDGDGLNETWGLAELEVYEFGWAPFVWGAGGRLFNEEKTALSPQFAGVIDGLEFYASLAHEHRITPAPVFWAPLETGRTGMQTLWLSYFSDLARNSSVPVDVAPFPEGPAGVNHLTGGTPIVVPVDTPYPEEAYKLARWLALESDLWKELDYMPIHAAQVPEYVAHMMDTFDSTDILNIVMEGARVEPVVGLVEFNRAMEIQERYISQLRAGSISATEAVTRMREELEAQVFGSW